MKSPKIYPNANTKGYKKKSQSVLKKPTSFTTTKPLLKKVANKHISEKIFNRPKQGFRAPVGEWIKKDQNYFYEGIYEFNKSTNLFNNKYLKSVLAGSDYQKKWYLSNLANWHLTRSKID